MTFSKELQKKLLTISCVPKYVLTNLKEEIPYYLGWTTNIIIDQMVDSRSHALERWLIFLPHYDKKGTLHLYSFRFA